MLNYTVTYRCRDKKLCDNILISTFLEELGMSNSLIHKEGDNKENSIYKTISGNTNPFVSNKENPSKFTSGKSLPPYVATYKTTAD